MALGNPTDDIILKIKAEKDDASKSIKSLKQELREALQEGVAISRQFGDNSKEAGKAAAKVANLRDEMDDFNQKVKALNPDKFARFATATTGIVNGFQAAQGAAVLFGAESEDLQKTMVKLQAVMAFSQGIQGVLDAKKAFGGLGAFVTGPVVAAFKTMSVAVRGALLATGIGVFVALIGTIAAYWDDIKEAVTGVSSEQEKAKATAIKLTEETQKALDLHKDSHEQLKLQGKTEKEILETEIKITNELITQKELSIQAQKDSVDAAVASRQKLFETLGVNNPLRLLFDSPASILAEGYKSIKAEETILNTMKETRAKALNAVTQIDETATKAAEDKKKEQAKTAETLRQEELQAELDMANKLNVLSKGKGEQGIKEADIIINAKKAVLDASKLTDAQIIKQLEETNALLLKKRVDFEATIKTYDAMSLDEKKEYHNKLRDMSLTASVSLIQSLQEMNTAFAGQSEAAQKRAFKRNKALAIAEAVISTYSAATKAYEAAFNPPTYASFVVGPVMAGVAIAAGLAKIATISKTTFMGSGGGTPPSGVNPGNTGGGIQAASTGFSFVKAPRTDDKGVKIDMKPVKVFVVSKDMKEGLKMDDSIQSKAVVK